MVFENTSGYRQINNFRHPFKVTKALARQVDFKGSELHLAHCFLDLADERAEKRALCFEAAASLNSTNGWHSEAAVALGHTIVCLMKNLIAKGEIENVDWSLLDYISENIMQREETFTLHPSEKRRREHGCNINRLYGYVLECIKELKLAERHEAIAPVCDFIIPVLRKLNERDKLEQILNINKDSIKDAIDSSCDPNRRLATYFCVSFHGATFGKTLNDTEWIYRERPYISLPQFCSELDLQLRRKLAVSDFKILPFAKIDPSDLEAEKAFVQVISVEPYFEDEIVDLADFFSHTNIRTFCYETMQPEFGTNYKNCEPPVTAQTLHRTIITCQQAFPSLELRIRTINTKRETIILDPLEHARHKMQVKNACIVRILNSVSESRPVDITALQLHVQGVLVATVNSGPIAYAHAFTSPDQIKRYGLRRLESLYDVFVELLNTCNCALAVNATYLDVGQLEYHELLVSRSQLMYRELTDCFRQMFFEPNLMNRATESTAP